MNIHTRIHKLEYAWLCTSRTILYVRQTQLEVLPYLVHRMHHLIEHLDDFPAPSCSAGMFGIFIISPLTMSNPLPGQSTSGRRSIVGEIGDHLVILMEV